MKGFMLWTAFPLSLAWLLLERLAGHAEWAFLIVACANVLGYWEGKFHQTRGES